MRGFRDWKNKKNGFYVSELHYTADPAKQTDEWRESAKHGMTEKAWQTEFELSWEVYSGTPVFGKEFKKELHVCEERYEPDPDLPILRGWDFGGNHAVVTAQNRRGRLYLIDEFANLGYNTRRIGQEVIEACSDLYPENRHYIEYIDPSGLWDNSKAAEGRACAQILREVYGLQLVPGIQAVQTRIDSVMKLLINLKEGEPMLRVNPGMLLTIQAFQSAYAYPETIAKNQKINKPEKTHPFSDLMDCIQYIATKYQNQVHAVNQRQFFDNFDDGIVEF